MCLELVDSPFLRHRVSLFPEADSSPRWPQLHPLMSPLVTYAFPALFVGALAGFFVGSTTNRGSEETAELTVRERFLSSDDDVVNYQKLARTCVAAAKQTCGQARTSARASVTAEPNSEEVEAAKAALDNVMSVSLKRGVWGSTASHEARRLLALLPPADVVDFENLLRTVLERGDLRVTSGAWVPKQN